MKLDDVFTYSNRLYNAGSKLEQSTRRTIIADGRCSTSHDERFNNVYYFKNIDYRLYPCGNDCTNAAKIKELNENNCKDDQPKGFKCTKVRIDDTTTITIPLFDTSMLDGENIKW